MVVNYHPMIANPAADYAVEQIESEAIYYRRRYQGLISVRSKVQVRDSIALSLVYPPGRD